MKTVISEEERHLDGFLGGTVIRKLSKRKQVESVVLLMIAEDAEVGLEGLIHPFCLTISLRMKSCGFPRINLKDRSESRPEVGGENGAVVGNNGAREAVELDNVGNEELCEFRSRCGLETRNEMGHLSHSVDEHED